jgi:hypothetical protein
MVATNSELVCTSTAIKWTGSASRADDVEYDGGITLI